MLLHLSIKNYVLIRELDIRFDSGLSIITGETGAGKSILLGALGLILGQRADTQVLLNKEQKCVIEGSFGIGAYNMEALFRLHDLDYSPTLILRREINPEGKSRAFVNDTPVNLSILREISDRLVDIHSQHKTLLLGEAPFQRAVLDNFSGIREQLSAYRETYSLWIQLGKKLETLREQENKARADQDYYSFLFQELSEIRLDPERTAELMREQDLLEHAAQVKDALQRCSGIFSGSDLSLLAMLSEVHQTLKQYAHLDQEMAASSARVESAYIDLKDVAREIELTEERIRHNPERLEHITAELDEIFRLQQKHRVQDVAGLMEIHDRLQEKLSGIESLETEIAKAAQELEETEKQLMAQAAQLHELRIRSAPQFAKKVEQQSRQLGMPEATFRAEITKLQRMTESGYDQVKFLFCANKGGEIRELSQVASGGELSRLMLSIKSLIAEKTLLPTIIFDEIDSGISGDTANKTAGVLQKMSSGMQVIAITHLPQIAGSGEHHYLVFKKSDNGSTQTFIRKLDDDERVKEIAQMISGQEITEAALLTARELLNPK